MVCLLDAITIAFGRTCTTPAPKADKSSQKRNERRAGILELQTLNHQIIPNSGMSAGALSFQFFSAEKAGHRSLFSTNTPGRTRGSAPMEQARGGK
jgi:hypothetical protein